MAVLGLLKKYPGAGVASLTTLIILWGMLLPGYILTQDLVFTPFFEIFHHFGEATNGFINALPLQYVILFLYSLFPGWVVEKVLLVGLFLTLSYVSFTYLPVPKRFSTKLFASLLYTANSFVYVRMLAGHWTHLYAYALLPLLLYLLIKSTEQSSITEETTTLRTYTDPVLLSLCLALIGVFSLHLFLMSVMATTLWFLVYLSFNFNTLIEEQRLFAFFKKIGVCCITLLILTSYWTIPAFNRTTTIESSFDSSHTEAFAASGHEGTYGTVPVLFNLATLNGFWGEKYVWADHFRWPQASKEAIFPTFLFWLAWVSVILLTLLGMHVLWKKRNDVASNKSLLVFLVLLGTSAYVLSTGVAPSPFQTLNTFLYSHLPFWSGLRDSHKFIAFLAITYAALAAYGFEYVVKKIENRANYYKDYLIPILFCIPVFFGMYVWFGFAGQLAPVDYPPSWYEAKDIVDKDTSATQPRVLVLPWEGYFSLAFAGNRIVANPTTQFYGPQVIASQNFRLGGIYDQTSDTPHNEWYREIDEALHRNSSENSLLASTSVIETLKRNGVKYIIHLQDIKEVDIFTYNFLKDPELELLLDTAEVKMYQVR